MIYNPYPTINLPFGKDNKYFYWLFEAICKVNQKYLRYSIPSAEKKDKYVPHLERVFAYELYRQWGNILEETKEDLTLNGEINKIININRIEFDNDNYSDSSEKREKVILYPDIVLHHSQSDDKGQLMICEIKRNHNLSGEKMFADLYKISCYMTKGLLGEEKEQKKAFTYGVFLIIGCNLSIINEKITEETQIEANNSPLRFSEFIKKTEHQEHFNRIICIAYDGTVLEYETLNNIISNKYTNKLDFYL